MKCSSLLAWYKLKRKMGSGLGGDETGSLLSSNKTKSMPETGLLSKSKAAHRGGETK